MPILLVASQLLRLTTLCSRQCVRETSRLGLRLFAKAKSVATVAEPQLGRGSARPAAEYSLSRITRALAGRRPSSQGKLACSHAAHNDTSALSPHRKAPAVCPGIMPKQASRNKPAFLLVHLLAASRIGLILFPVDKAPPYLYQLSPALSARNHMGAGAETSVLAGQAPINEAAGRSGRPSCPHAHLIASRGGADKR